MQAIHHRVRRMGYMQNDKVEGEEHIEYGMGEVVEHMLYGKVAELVGIPDVECGIREEHNLAGKEPGTVLHKVLVHTMALDNLLSDKDFRRQLEQQPLA